VTKRLVVCCDGTWNRPDQVSGGSVAPTNVTKVALGVAAEDGDGATQVLHYQKGVGTRRFEHLSGGALGLGLSRDVQDCYRFLVESYEPGDALYFFGFSRGAFTARSLAGLVRNSGILRLQHADRIKDAWSLYRARADQTKPTGVEAQIFRRMYSHEDPEIHFLGMWDTVGSLGIPIPIPFLNKVVNKRWGFHDTALSSRVRFAYHALAIDEKRGPFEPTLWKQQRHSRDQTLEQVWFAGVHCDVGGGYHEPELAEIPLLWMVDRARGAGLAFRADHFQPPAHGADEERRRLGAEVAPDALGTIHESLEGVFLLAWRHPRPLIEVDGGAVASSALRRMEELPAYKPPALAAYLAAGGDEKDVQDSP
jgi:uncharacterized protein (DUF2235 family)